MGGLGDIQGLVDRSRAGDREAFRELVEAHLDAVWRLARQLTGNDADAEDLSQEAFLRVWRGIAAFRGESTFKTWVFRIVINVQQTTRTTEARQPKPLPIAESSAEGKDPSGHAVAVARELAVRVREEISLLPEKQRLAITLAAYEGLTVEEIAEVVGARPETVKVNLWLARKKLRDQLGDDIGEVHS